MRSYLDLLRRRPGFRVLVGAEIISLVGDWFTLVAVSLLTGGGSRGMTLMALTFVAHTLPQALLGPFAGPLADFVDRRAALVGTAALQGLLTLAMFGAGLAGAVGWIPVLVLVRGVFGAMREPAASASLPSLVDKSELVRANALLSASWSATFALGMGLGGLVASIDPKLAIGVDAASFGLAALLLTFLPKLGAADPDAPKRLHAGALLRGIRSALGVAVRDRALGRAVFSKTPLSFAAGAAWMMLNAGAIDRPFLGSAGLTLGVIQSIRGIATGVGPILAERIISRGASARLVDRIVVGGSFAAMAAFVASNAPSVAPWACLAVAVVWGMGVGANWVLTTSEIQRRGPDGFLGRLASIDTLAWSLGQCASALLMAVCVDRGAPAIPLGLAIVGAGVGLELLLSLWMREPRTLAA